MKKFLLYTSISLIVVIIAITLTFIIYFSVKTKDIELDLVKLEHVKTSTMLDNSDKIINEDSYVKYEDIPKSLIDAFISIEDKRFFEHNGIDIRRMLGASIYNLKNGSKRQGASTITQQLIKNTHLTQSKTFDRKFKEIKLAIKLEKVLLKEEIMERYLNSLYFGNGIYGIKNAANKIFNKDLHELTIAEMATIAGIVKAPLYYSPINNKDKSIKRRNVILKEMLDDGYISNNEYITATNSDIFINNGLIYNKTSDIYTNQVISEATQILEITKSELINGNYTIATYYDREMQEALLAAINASKDIIGANHVNVLLSNNATSSISAIYTDIDRDIIHFKRQVGSIMKPIAVYLPAIDMGIINPAMKYSDMPITFGDYSPHNYGEIYRGNISIKDAIAHSSNIVATSVLNDLGIDNAKKYLSKMDIYLEDNGLSIALGGLKEGLTPIEILSSYQTIANNGNYSKNTFIRYIKDSNGNMIYRHKISRNRVFSEESSYLMTDMLINTAINGTSKKLGILPYQIAAKTGTVAHPDTKNINTDAYNVSFTSDNTLLVWFGDNLEKNIQGGSHPTILARYIYQNLYDNNHYPNDFTMPSGVERHYFDKETYEKDGQILIKNDDVDAYSELFDVNHLPKGKYIDAKDIKYRYFANQLHLYNVYDTTIRIYSVDLFDNKKKVLDIYHANEEEIIELPYNILSKYKIEIYYVDKLIYSILA